MPRLSHTLRQALRKRQEYTKETFGLEFEVEGKNIVPFDSNYWTAKSDASLRNGGLEWVTRAPFSIKDLVPAINSWFAHIKTHKIEPVESIRTSIHVHLNALPFTIKEIYTILCAYYLVENLLISYSGLSRKGNLFCLSLSDADAITEELIDIIENDKTLRPLGNIEKYKYAALNIPALLTYGTFEFRMMAGRYNNPEFIIEWVSELCGMINKAAKTFDNPKEVVNCFKNTSPIEFLQKLFSDEFISKLIYDVHGNFTIEMQENFFNVYAIAYSHPDWVDSPTEKKKIHKYSLPEHEDSDDTPTLSTTNTPYHTLLQSAQSATTITPLPNWAVEEAPESIDDLLFSDNEEPF